MAKRTKWVNTATIGFADIEKLRAMTDEEIERTAPPELSFFPDDFWRDARVVIPNGKAAISIRVDEDVLSWFRATGLRYQSRMNAVLRSYAEQMGRAKPAKKSAKDAAKDATRKTPRKKAR
jgi:uncharacterized protein (DUF4415 family)